MCVNLGQGAKGAEMPTIFMGECGPVSDVWHPEYRHLVGLIVGILRSMNQHQQNLVVAKIGGLRTRESQPSPTEVAIAAAEQGKLGKLWSEIASPSVAVPTLIDGEASCG
jgi:hypothetical protein